MIVGMILWQRSHTIFCRAFATSALRPTTTTTTTRCASIHRPTSYRPVCGSVFCRGHRVKWWVSLLPLSASARTFSSNTANEDELFGRDTNDNNCPPQKIAIVGGGLAGLSTAFHMLELAHERNLQSPLDITVLDRHQVGLGGASAVAGGLVHPLSPRGKLVHWGREGLQATNHLIEQAGRAHRNDNIVLCSEIYRIATSQQQADQLQRTAQNVIPDLCEWLSPDELSMLAQSDDSTIYGGLRLYNGCKVLHLPSYLQGLWAACQAWETRNSTFGIKWEIQDLRELSTTSALDKFDTVVWAAGDGLFALDGPFSFLHDGSNPQVQLVRGQSVEIRLPSDDNNDGHENHRKPALLSGKYVSPMPDPNILLVGATHEYGQTLMPRDQVKEELRKRTESFCSHVWGDGTVVERYTSGTRVQSRRGSSGRLPIVGKFRDSNDRWGDDQSHWIFTGLSSRGLLYHGVYGRILAEAILDGSENCLEKRCFEFDWWRQKVIDSG